MKQEALLLNDGKDDGWIKVYRKMLDNPIFKDSETLQLFLYCLLRANFKPNDFLFNGQVVHLERGQFIFGLRKASKALKMSIRKLRTRLLVLGKLGITTHLTTHRFSIITVCNYNHYQDIQNDQGHIQRHSDDTVTTTNKNVKNKEYVEGSDELRLASLLLEEIRKNQPTCREPNLQTWAKEINLMIRRDGRTPDQIEKVIRWCQGDAFWWKNILSASKLRKQFDRLEAEMASPKGKVKEMPQAEYKDLTGGGRL